MELKNKKRAKNIFLQSKTVSLTFSTDRFKITNLFSRIFVVVTMSSEGLNRNSTRK